MSSCLNGPYFVLLQALAPEYAKAAGILAEKESTVALAKVYQLYSFSWQNMSVFLLVGCDRGTKGSRAV